jgi:hypothetical protein
MVGICPRTLQVKLTQRHAADTDGWTAVDESGLRLSQIKTGVDVWCPTAPELEADMRRWERRLVSRLLNEFGRRYRGVLFEGISRSLRRDPGVRKSYTGFGCNPFFACKASRPDQ